MDNISTARPMPYQPPTESDPTVHRRVADFALAVTDSYAKGWAPNDPTTWGKQIGGVTLLEYLNEQSGRLGFTTGIHCEGAEGNIHGGSDPDLVIGLRLHDRPSHDEVAVIALLPRGIVITEVD